MLRRKTAGSIVLLAATVALTTAPAAQPTPDHLYCYKVKDWAPIAIYTADLTGLAAEPGCTIKVPGKLLCVDATNTNVNPPPPGGGPSGGNAGKFVCYRIKCPTATFTAVPVVDQFGMRNVQPSSARMLCAPSS